MQETEGLFDHQMASKTPLTASFQHLNREGYIQRLFFPKPKFWQIKKHKFSGSIPATFSLLHVCWWRFFEHSTKHLTISPRPLLNVFTGRTRKWFKVDEATRVLQSHKPVHAEYLRRLTSTCIAPCAPVCSPTNGNTPSSQGTDGSTPHYVVCSTQGSDVANR